MQTPTIELKASTIFARQELTEVLLIVYNILNRALRDGADTLQVEGGRFTWSSAGVERGQFSAARLPQPDVFGQALDMILARDHEAQQHVQPLPSTGHGQQYRLS